jgi:oxaloacetate decarboxylase gamma subunit
MLGQSGIFTLLGMGIVFGFLVILVACVNLAGKCIRAIGADKDVRELPTAQAGQAAPGGSGNAAVTAAISAAVNEYQKTR